MQPNGRITKLDGLRGILSLIVALNHSFLVLAIPAYANVWGQNYLEFHDWQSKIQQIFMILGNGGVAVTLFFVLSGLVLGQSLSKIILNFRNLMGFYLKRLSRLYPVYLFIIMVIALYMRLGFTYMTFPHASTWYHWWMNFSMTFKEFLLNASFVHIYLGGVTWTLRVIIVASFLFPLFYLLSKRTSKTVDLLVIAGLVYLAFFFFNFENFRDLRYLFMFYFGLILPKFRDSFEKIPEKFIAFLLPFALIFMFIIRYQTDEYVGGVFEAIISFLLIGIITYNNFSWFDVLNKKVLLWFGKISYSLYLVNFSMIYILAREMFIYFPNLPYTNNYVLIHLAILFVSLIFTIPTSMFIHRFVETPSAKLSDKVSKTFIK